MSTFYCIVSFSIMNKQRAISRTGDNLTETLHQTIYQDIDPCKMQLRSPFVACIIGASRGIGAGVAKAFATAGASTVILAARSTSQLRDVEEDIKRTRPETQVWSISCDVTSAESVRNLAAQIERDAGRLDAVVYNSGFSGPVILRVTEGNPADFERTFAVNSVGTYLAAHFLIPLLLKSPDGAKVFLAVATAASWITDGIIANTGYCISKMAQMRLIEMISLQYSGEGLFAVGIHPGAVGTEMAYESAPEEFKKCMRCS